VHLSVGTCTTDSSLPIDAMALYDRNTETIFSFSQNLIERNLQLRSSLSLKRIDPPVPLLDQSRAMSPPRGQGNSPYPLMHRMLPIVARRWVHSVHVTLNWSTYRGIPPLQGYVYVVGTTAVSVVAGNDDAASSPVMPYTHEPPPSWLESLKADQLMRPANRQERSRLRRQRLVLESRLTPNGQGGEIRFSFEPREGETYHLWCDIDNAVLLGPGQMVSVIIDDDEGNVVRNYRALWDSGVLRKPLPCYWGDDRALSETPYTCPIPKMYPNLLLAACRQLRSPRKQLLGDDPEQPLTLCISRYGIPTTVLSMIAVEELVLENLRLGEHEAQEQSLLRQWEMARRARPGRPRPGRRGDLDGIYRQSRE
jgi:hypothetical protein